LIAVVHAATSPWPASGQSVSKGAASRSILIPRGVDNDPFDGARRPTGQARPAARCPRIWQGSQRTRRAAARHRRPGLLDRPLRCAPLTVHRTAARNAPDGRSSKPGQMSHYQRPLVLAWREEPDRIAATLSASRTAALRRKVAIAKTQVVDTQLPAQVPCQRFWSQIKTARRRAIWEGPSHDGQAAGASR